MKDSLKEIYTEVFNNKLLVEELWDSRISNEDILSVKSNFPVRNKKCEEDRSIEVLINSRFGLFTTQLCLITQDSFVFPRTGIPKNISQSLKNDGYKVKYYSDEHDVTAAAFSMDSLLLALENKDSEFEIGTHKMEIIVAFDGSINCLKKGGDSQSDLAMFSFVNQMNHTKLDNEIVSIYKFNDGRLGAFSTPLSEKYYTFLIKKRRLEVFTLEK